MKKVMLATILFSTVNQANAWNFSFKADVQHSSTDNVNLTSNSPTSDTFNSLGGYIQTKDDSFKIKLRGKTEKYKSQTANDNYSMDLSLQYKQTKALDYTVNVFKQVYNGSGIVSTDSTSDNTGGRLSTSYSHDFDKETSGYIGLNGTSKKYPKISDRKDLSLGANAGLEHYYDKNFLINPELSFANNNSSQTYYKNSYYGPSILFSFTPNDELELFVSGSYTHTTYSGRTVSTVVRNKTTTADEYQNLVSAEFGLNYTIAKNFPFQFKYSTNKNSSNNSTSGYQAKILNFGIGMKF